MSTGEDLRRIALSLAGTVEAPHFDRAAFKVARIYATMSSDRLTANLRLSPEEQEFRCLLNGRAFAPVPNAWGRQGWTTVTLSEVEPDELASALESAWRDAKPKRRGRRSG
jgi:hypothetical protein